MPTVTAVKAHSAGQPPTNPPTNLGQALEHHQVPVFPLTKQSDVESGNVEARHKLKHLFIEVKHFLVLRSARGIVVREVTQAGGKSLGTQQNARV